MSSRSEEHTSELQSRENLVCRLLLEKKKKHFNKILYKKKKKTVKNKPRGGKITFDARESGYGPVPDLLREHLKPDVFFFLMIRPPPRFTLFPYTTLFRSYSTSVVRMGSLHPSQVLRFPKPPHIFFGPMRMRAPASSLSQIRWAMQIFSSGIAS